jgi:hypothetical protein
MSPEASGRLSHTSSADSALDDAEGLVAEGDFDAVACVEGETDVVACAAEACFVGLELAEHPLKVKMTPMLASPMPVNLCNSPAPTRRVVV